MEIGLITELFVLATLVEGVITYAFGESVDKQQRPYLKGVSIALGIAFAIAYEASLPGILGFGSTVPFVDYIVTGLVIGRGSNYLNDIISTIKTAAKSA